MIKGDWADVKAIDENARKMLPVGGYVARITSVQNVAQKQYIKVDFDIAEGEFSGYYADLHKRKGFWGGSFVRSYKSTAQGFFKGFIVSVEESNEGLVLITDKGIDESKLEGKLVGVIMGEEEYMGNDGKVKTRIRVSKTTSVDKIRSGDFIVPERKVLEQMVAPPAVDVIDTTVAIPSPESFQELEDDLPF